MALLVAPVHSEEIVRTIKAPLKLASGQVDTLPSSTVICEEVEMILYDLPYFFPKINIYSL